MTASVISFRLPCFARYLLPLALLFCLAPTHVRAHAYLQRAIPAQRSTLFAPPDRVQLWFNERLEPGFCTVTVSDASGKTVDRGDGKVADDDPKQITVGLQPVTPGVYTVQFRVLSVDGHVVNDKFTFTVRGSR